LNATRRAASRSDSNGGRTSGAHPQHSSSGTQGSNEASRDWDRADCTERSRFCATTNRYDASQKSGASQKSAAARPFTRRNSIRPASPQNVRVRRSLRVSCAFFFFSFVWSAVPVRALLPLPKLRFPSVCLLDLLGVRLQPR
jgi:hypothetical protein